MADLLIPQGKTWKVAFPIVGEFETTGWSIRSQVRPYPKHADVLHEWSSTAGTAGFETVTAAALTAAGQPSTVDRLCVVLTVAPVASADWDWTEGVYDIEATDGVAVLLIASGTVKVIPEVTR